MHTFPQRVLRYAKYAQPRPGFELGSPTPFRSTITITPQAQCGWSLLQFTVPFLAHCLSYRFIDFEFFPMSLAIVGWPSTAKQNMGDDRLVGAEEQKTKLFICRYSYGLDTTLLMIYRLYLPGLFFFGKECL